MYTLGIASLCALYAVNHWERFGIVRSERVGRHRFVSLDPEFVAARELRMLLRESSQAAPTSMGFAEPPPPALAELVKRR